MLIDINIVINNVNKNDALGICMDRLHIKYDYAF